MKQGRGYGGRFFFAACILLCLWFCSCGDELEQSIIGIYTREVDLISGGVTEDVEVEGAWEEGRC